MAILAQDTFDADTIGSIAPGFTNITGAWTVMADPLGGTNRVFGSAVDGNVVVQTAMAAAGYTRLDTQQLVTGVTSPTSQNVGLGVRMAADGSNGYLLVPSTPSANTVTLSVYKKTGGSYSSLGSGGSLSISLNDVLSVQFIANGTTLEGRLSKNGAALPTTATVSVTDSSYSSGRIGFYLQVNNSSGTPAIQSYAARDNVLASGAASVTSADASQIGLLVIAADSGSGSYSYQWHRSTTSGFTPALGTSLSGATSLAFSDTTATPGVQYFYKNVVTDSASATSVSNQVAAVRYVSTIKIGAIGDSIMLGYQATVGSFANMLSSLNKGSATLFQGTNRAITGTKTTDWAPAGTNLVAAKSAFASAGVSLVVLMLGTNDSQSGVALAASSYQTNVAAIAADLVGSGYRVLLFAPPSYLTNGLGSYAPYDESGLSLIQQYAGSLATTANGTTIRLGDVQAFGYFADHTSELADGLHPNDAGAVSLGEMWARSLVNAGLTTTVGTATTVGVTNIDAAAASVSGVVASVFSKTAAGTPAKRLFSVGRTGDESASTLTFGAASGGTCSMSIAIPAGVGGIDTGDALLVYLEKDPESSGSKTAICAATAT